MAASEQEAQVVNEQQVIQPEQEIVPEPQQEEYVAPEEAIGQEEEPRKRIWLPTSQGDKTSFFHGLSAGLGIGCIATFVIIWVAVFFTPQLPPSITYENMLSVFIFPLIYLLAVGLVALTAGIVRQYYSVKR